MTMAMDKTSEFAQLQREYRHMELNRKSYADESYLVLRKQQASIAKLRRDNDTLKMELGLETRRNVLKPAEVAESSRYHEEAERLDRAMRDEAQHNAELDENIQVMRMRSVEQRKNMGGVNAARENQAMVSKQIKILENRLDQALVKFNQALARNKALRESIDDLRRERVVFDNIYRKLERELHEKKKQMANVIELSNLSYEQRDNYQMEIAAIEQANRKEQAEFEGQMLELGRLLDNELKLPTTNLTNSTSQKSLTQQQQQATIQSSSSNPALITDGSSPPSSPSRKSQVGSRKHTTTGTSHNRRGDLSKEKARAELAVGQERVQNFEEAFNRIKVATGISAIDELVRMFIKNEDQNFSLFNYVNEQTNEIEKLGEQVQQLVDEEAKYAQESGEDVNQHQQLLNELEKKLDSTEKQVGRYEEKCEAHQTVLDNLKKCIASVFAKTRCEDRVSSGDASGVFANADSAVTEANMLPYLAIIEEQCNSIIKDYVAAKQRQQQNLLKQINHAASKENTNDAEANALLNEAQASAAGPQASVLGLGPSTPMGQDLIHVNPPKLEDYSSEEDDDDDDEETRPLTRDELKAKTLNRMYRRVNHRETNNSRNKQQQQRTTNKPKK